MTTAHRPTFAPAKGKAAAPSLIYHAKNLPAHTQLKFRQAGQGTEAEAERRDLRAELLQAEARHYSKLRGNAEGETNDADEEPDSKRRRILMATRDLDADDDDADATEGGEDNDKDNDDNDDGEEDDDDDENDDDDDEEETAALMRELEKIKRERAERMKEEEAAQLAREQAQREEEMAFSNPLMRPQSHHDFKVKRRWDQDVVFTNQARGLKDEPKRDYVNDMLRSEFHKKFMNKFIK